MTFVPAQLLDEKEADVEGLADKVEELARRLAEKEADLEAEQAESAALTHDLKKVGIGDYTGCRFGPH